MFGLVSKKKYDFAVRAVVDAAEKWGEHAHQLWLRDLELNLLQYEMEKVRAQNSTLITRMANAGIRVRSLERQLVDAEAANDARAVATGHLTDGLHQILDALGEAAAEPFEMADLLAACATTADEALAASAEALDEAGM